MEIRPTVLLRTPYTIFNISYLVVGNTPSPYSPRATHLQNAKRYLENDIAGKYLRILAVHHQPIMGIKVLMKTQVFDLQLNSIPSGCSCVTLYSACSGRSNHFGS